MARIPDPDRDDRLTRLGRDWFAEVRARHAVDEGDRARRERKRDDVGSSGDDGDGSWFDWLFGDGDGTDPAGDAAGD